MKPYLNDASGELTQQQAEVYGAFPEDAVSEVDALGSVDDDYATPAEALASKSV